MRRAKRAQFAEGGMRDGSCTRVDAVGCAFPRGG